MFAYCGNNPVSRADTGGEFWDLATGALFGGLISGISQIVTNVVTGTEWSSGVLTATVAGAVSGALAASTVGRVGQIVGNALISGVSEVINQYNNYTNNPSEFDYLSAAGSVAVATGLGAVAGAIGGEGARTPGSNYRLALDNADDVAAKVASKVYSNPATPAKLLNHANKMITAAGNSTVIITAVRFFAGAQVAQYGMAGWNEFIDSIG